MDLSPFSLYFHIPFCGQRCPYCDFNTYVEARIPESEYTQALIAEMEHRAAHAAWKGRGVRTIFFGGGTPSLFSPASLGSLVDAARDHFGAAEEIEISIEVNPGTVSLEYFSALAQCGFNRISIGAQSFNQRSLQELGRAHSTEQTIEAARAARRAGFRNINLDLIYALPNQSYADFEADLAALCAQNPEHISAYQLTIEKGTPFSFRFHQGNLPLPAEEETVRMMERLPQTFASAGYEQYEISNFAKPGRTCRHNQAYWNGEDYLGLGAGAHSFCAAEGDGYGRRWSNYALPTEYMKQAREHGTCESWRDSLSREARQFEFFFLGLRRSRGVSITEFAQAFGFEMDTRYGETVERLQKEALLERDGDLLFLSERGKLLSDSVFQEFIIDE